MRLMCAERPAQSTTAATPLSCVTGSRTTCSSTTTCDRNTSSRLANSGSHAPGGGGGVFNHCHYSESTFLSITSVPMTLLIFQPSPLQSITSFLITFSVPVTLLNPHHTHHCHCLVVVKLACPQEGEEEGFVQAGVQAGFSFYNLPGGKEKQGVTKGLHSAHLSACTSRSTQSGFSCRSPSASSDSSGGREPSPAPATILRSARSTSSTAPTTPSCPNTFPPSPSPPPPSPPPPMLSDVAVLLSCGCSLCCAAAATSVVPAVVSCCAARPPVRGDGGLNTTTGPTVTTAGRQSVTPPQGTTQL
ncbi:hypothetical protein E2C01_039737 [Portunus trituberculatus]|uniref:Uncharacterized protein n=1 Tax=Portunus trituberculatus TaxID=210409 RepID=A0A5B7FEJ5_PORTR|nr:hypothetical protein [Portunus trituberculatus]